MPGGGPCLIRAFCCRFGPLHKGRLLSPKTAGGVFSIDRPILPLIERGGLVWWIFFLFKSFSSKAAETHCVLYKAVFLYKAEFMSTQQVEQELRRICERFCVLRTWDSDYAHNKPQCFYWRVSRGLVCACVCRGWVGGPVSTFLTKPSEMGQGKGEPEWRTFIEREMAPALC